MARHRSRSRQRFLNSAHCECVAQHRINRPNGRRYAIIRYARSSLSLAVRHDDTKNDMRAVNTLACTCARFVHVVSVVDTAATQIRGSIDGCRADLGPECLYIV